MKPTSLLIAASLATQLQAQPLYTSQADFCVRMLQDLQTQDANKNLFFSSYSAHQVLTMTMLGAPANSTNYVEMAKALGWDKSPLSQLKPYYTQMEEDTRVKTDKVGLWQPIPISEAYQENITAMQAIKSVKLLVANSLWVNTNITANKAYSEQLQKYFKSDVYPFATNTDKACEASKKLINGWIARQTQNLIKDVLNSVPKDAIIYLVNAIYFKGDWLNEFPKQNTQKMSFHNSDKTKQDVDMMYKEMTVHYAADAHGQIVRLPYKGNEVAMYIFLPNSKTTMQAWVQQLNGFKLETILNNPNNAAKTKVRVWLPKFKMDSGVVLLNEMLKRMGMKRAFVHGNEFSNMANGEIAISRVLHRAVLEVNEKGSEAAAATVVEMTTESARPVEPDPIEFKADRPFFLAIRHDATKTILFVGKVENLK